MNNARLLRFLFYKMHFLQKLVKLSPYTKNQIYDSKNEIN